MMKWKLIKLGEICDIVTGGTPDTSINEYWDNGDIPWLPSGTCQNCIIKSANTFITKEGLANSSAKIMPINTVVIALTGATTGKVGILNIEACANQSVTGILPNDALYYKYIFYCLMFSRNRILEDSYGGAQKHISQGYVKNFKIPQPPMDIQIAISNNLDKVTNLIEVCRNILVKLDLLVKSRFVEMFGDKKYPYQELISLIIEGAGLSYGIVQPGDDGTGDMGVLRPVDIVDGSIVLDNIKFIDREIASGYQKTELTGKELLITVRGTTGVTAVSDKRFCGMNVTRGIAVIRYDEEKINPIYLNEYLKSDESQRYIQENTRGATLKQINLSDLRIQKILLLWT